MQKTVFMASMMQMQALIMSVAHLGKSLTLLKDEKGKPLEDVNLEGAEIVKCAEEMFVDTGKTIRAFFMANDKEKYNYGKFEEQYGVHASRNALARGNEESIKNSMKMVVAQLEAEVLKHQGVAMVFHDNGKIWKKNKNDKKRFVGLEASVGSVSNFLS